MIINAMNIYAAKSKSHVVVKMVLNMKSLSLQVFKSLILLAHMPRNFVPYSVFELLRFFPSFRRISTHNESTFLNPIRVIMYVAR